MKPRTPAATIDLAPLHLRAEVRAESVDADARTAEVVWSTGAPVQRFDWMTGQRYIETLSLDPKHVRLERLNGGAPLLNAHNSFELRDVIGVVQPGTARVEGGKAKATVRFSARADVEPIFQDVRDGILRAVSVGYRVHKYEQTEGSEKSLPRRHAIDWEPFEISAVPMGADPRAGFRGDAKAETNPCVLVTRAAEKERAMPPKIQLEEPAATPAETETRESSVGPVRDVTDPGAPVETPAQTEARQTEATERQEGAATERARVQGIMQAVEHAGLSSTFARKLIDEGLSLEKAQSLVLAEVSRRDRDSRGPRVGGVAIRAESDPLDHVRAGIATALLHRADPKAFALDDLGRMYAHRSLIEYAELCLQARGVRTTGMNKMEIAGLALGLQVRAGMHTVSDFPIILADVANKTLRRAYDEAPQTFTAIARRVLLPDFKSVKRNQLGEAPALLEVKDHGEFTRGTIGEAKEEYALATYGRVFAITRKSLVNDDTDAFSRLTMMFGRAARHLESDLVWQQITSNPTMGDGVALFHATHGNLSGTSDAIAVAPIGAGRAAMRNQKGLDQTQFLNLVPRFLIVPPAKETLADQFVSTALLASQPGSVNPFAGRLQVLSEPRLEVASATAWYLAASPDQIDMVEWGVLAGEEGPVVETRLGFDIDGIEVKARHDVAAKVIDWRGFYKNPGA